MQEQSFPISDARVITLATPPFGKSYPKTTLIALLGLLVGLGGGLGHSLVLRNSDRTVRRPRDVEERLGLECLGLVPLIATNEPPEKHGGEVPKKPGERLPNKQMLAATERLAALVPNKPASRANPPRSNT